MSSLRIWQASSFKFSHRCAACHRNLSHLFSDCFCRSCQCKEGSQISGCLLGLITMTPIYQDIDWTREVKSIHKGEVEVSLHCTTLRLCLTPSSSSQKNGLSILALGRQLTFLFYLTFYAGERIHIVLAFSCVFIR